MSLRFLFSLFLIGTVFFVCECAIGNRLGKFIRHYDPVYYNTVDLHNRHRRAVESNTDSRFEFSAFGKFHKLNLKPDRGIFTKDAKILSGDGSPIPFDHDAVVKGNVEGDHYSDVYGVIDKRDGFHGKILSGTDDYYVDPSSWYFDEPQEFPSVMYKAEDVEYDVNYPDIHQRAPNAPNRQRRSSDAKERRSKRQTQQELEKSACILGLYADNFFTELYGGKTKAIFQLVKQVQAAQIIYTDEFNETDLYSPYGISFRVKSIVVYDETDVPADIKEGNVGIDTLLDLFSKFDHSTVCEAFLFTDRDFEGGILGLAWIGDGTGGSAGGICDPHRDYGGGKVRSYNTGIVTMKLYGRFTPPRISEITFAHELGHGFGSQHDRATDMCAPGGTEGNYIMFDKATSGVKVNNDKFSSCSKTSIKENIDKKRADNPGCFMKSDEPICGNKIVEKGEQCDCGDDETCKEDCCVPGSQTSTPNPRQCKLKSGKQCSPSQGPCCSSECQYDGPAHVCLTSNGCTKNTSCSGFSFSCPVPEPLKNETLCDQGRRICFGGQCSTSVCEKYSLKECHCTLEEEMCDLCCQEEGGTCMSAKNLQQLPAEQKELKLVPGTPCDNLHGYCDVFAVCRRVDMQGPLLRLKQKFLTVEGLKETVKQYWWAILLGTIVFVVIIGLLVKLCSVYTPSSNPHTEAKKPARKVPGRKRREQPPRGGVEMQSRA